MDEVKPREDFAVLRELVPQYFGLKAILDAEKAGYDKLVQPLMPFAFTSDSHVFQYKKAVADYKSAEFAARERINQIANSMNVIGRQLADAIEFAGVWYRVPNGYVKKTTYRGQEFEYRTDTEIFKAFEEGLANGTDGATEDF